MREKLRIVPQRSITQSRNSSILENSNPLELTIPKEKSVSKLNSKPKQRNFTSIIIAPFTQIKFGLYMIVISLLFIILTSGLVIHSFIEQYKQILDIFNIVDPTIQWEMITNDVFMANAIRLGAFFGLFLVVMLYVSFKLTHRYYGPLVSIERFIDQITKGNYGSRVTIRSNDELQDLVKKLNELASALESRHGKSASPTASKSNPDKGTETETETA